MHTDLKHYIFFSVGQIGKIAGSMVATAILARFLDPSGLGRWTMIVAAATLLHSLFGNWLQQDPFLRFGKQEWLQQHTLKHTWSTQLPLLAIGLLLGLIITLVLGLRSNGLFHFSLLDALLAFGFFASLVISIDLQTLLQITGRMKRLALAPMLISIISVFFYLGLWLSHPQRYGVEISLGGTILLTIFVWLAVGVRVLGQTGFTVRKCDVAGIKTFLHYAYPILPTALLGYCMNWGNQVLIHRFFSNYEVGLYQSAFQVHTLGVTMALPFTTILLPKLIDKHHQDPTTMKRFVETVSPTLFCLWLLVVIPGIAILPWMFLKIYGHSFQAGILPLVALLAGTPFCALSQIYAGLFTIQGKLGRIFWIVFIMVGVNFLTAWVIWPHDQITLRTIGLSFSAAFALTQFLVYSSQHRFLGVPSLKIDGLGFITLIFSIGECLLLSTGLRILWSAFMTLCLIVIIRRWNIVEGSLLKQLFSGRLEGCGDFLAALLLTKKKGVVG